MQYLTRLAFNSSHWHHPKGEAKDLETGMTQSRKYGFAHEEWLFRSEWLIGDWRYAFIQGVNAGGDKHVKAGRHLDLILYTVDKDKRWRLVATVLDVECLDDTQAVEALEIFMERGWFNTMLDEVEAIRGDKHTLETPEFAAHVLNVRFRLGNVKPFPEASYLPHSKWTENRKRYKLYGFEQTDLSDDEARPRVRKRRGTAEPPNIASYTRRGSKGVEVTPEHARMQETLMGELQVEFPGAEVVAEKNFVDVSVCSPSELLLFEIKSDLDPRTVIRYALGQIMEYAFHPRNEHDLPPQLVIVGRRPLEARDEEYLERLKRKFSLPLDYRVVPID